MKNITLHAQIQTELFNYLSHIKIKRPIVHNITNYVVMELTANALLAIGASPIMAHAAQELADITNLVSSLVINIGTLDPSWIESMKQAIKHANRKNIPIILDPVGAGASMLRTQSAQAFLKTGSIDVIRANAAEIMALAELNIHSFGVDSAYQTEAALSAAQTLAAKYGCIVVISGASDIVHDKDKIWILENGSPMMAKVTGMGCTGSALLGAFCSVSSSIQNSDLFYAAICAVSALNLAGERAANLSQSPGSFRTHLIDALYLLSQKTPKEDLHVKIKILTN